MSWERKKDVKCIFNAFKRNKERVYKEDIEALKNIDEFIDQTSKNYVNGNLLFAKIYCITLFHYLRYYKNIKSSVKEINKELKLPLSFHIEMLTNELNNYELYNFFESIGLDMENNYLSKSKKGIEQSEIIKEKHNEIISKLQKSWNIEEVEKSFYNSANDLLKEIENYV